MKSAGVQSSREGETMETQRGKEAEDNDEGMAAKRAPLFFKAENLKRVSAVRKRYGR